MTTTGRISTRPSVEFDRNSFLPFSDGPLLPRVKEVAPSSTYPESVSRSVAPAFISQPSSHIPPFSASGDVGNQNISNEIASARERSNVSAANSSQLLVELESRAGPAVYS